MKPEPEPEPVILMHEAAVPNKDCREELLTSCLRVLAKQCGNNEEDWVEKYGGTFENKVFAMHPYCWCEKENCVYCNEEVPNFIHKKSGLSITWYKYIGRSMEIEGDQNEIEILNIMVECLESMNIPL